MLTLEEFAAQLAAGIAPEHGLTPEQAIRIVEYRLNVLRDEYRAIGAPLGDTDDGFLLWLKPRHQPPTA